MVMLWALTFCSMPEQQPFFTVGSYHHHIGLDTRHTEGAGPAPKKLVGLYHFAFNYPTRKDLGRALKRLLEKSYPISGSSDHNTHLAIYVNDADGNGIEMALDRDGNDRW